MSTPLPNPPPSRNHPCPCGSGLRFKNCHGALAPEGGGALDLARQSDAHWRRGDLASAEALAREAIAQSANAPEAWNMLGLIVRDAGRPEEALEAFRSALRIDPSNPYALSNLGDSLMRLDRPEEALSVLGPEPATVEATYARALALARLGRETEMLRALERCSELLPGPLRELEATLRDRHARKEEADARWLSDRGNTELAEVRLGLSREISAITQRLHAEPTFDKPASTLTTVALRALELPRAWRAYPLRPSRAPFNRAAPAPGRSETTRLPANLDATMIELWGMEGLGDSIFFLRYAGRLKHRGARVRYRGDPRLTPILARTGVIDEFAGPGEPPSNESDFVLPESDLLTLAGEPRIEDLPPPLALPPLANAVSKARAALGDASVVAVTWRGGIETKTHVAGRIGAPVTLTKNIDPFLLGRALRGSGDAVVSVQRLPTPDENRRFEEGLGRPFVDLSEWNHDLEDILGLMAVVDRYVGVSNTNMHLRAGAGRTATVLLPHRSADWRWAGEGSDSVWFPGFRVLRQRHDDPDWSAVLGSSLCR